MKKKFLQFLLRLTILSAILALVTLVLAKYSGEKIISPELPYLFILFYPVTALVHYILLRITALNPRKFVGYFMLSTSLKLLVYLVVMVILAITLEGALLPFVLGFFILYIIYTTFEVVQILVQTRDQPASQNN